jgi:Holliday junction resolvase RusA-like endonuclease
MPFVMLLPRRPVSLQKKGPKDRYQEEIRGIAEKIIEDTRGKLFEDDLYVRIIWFHAERAIIDVDNIIKPILDALKGIVYEDDARVSQCLATRVNIQRGDYMLSTRNISSDVYDELIRLLGGDTEHIIYVEVGQVYSQRVTFGPIDGDAE